MYDDSFCGWGSTYVNWTFQFVTTTYTRVWKNMAKVSVAGVTHVNFTSKVVTNSLFIQHIFRVSSYKQKAKNKRYVNRL